MFKYLSFAPYSLVLLSILINYILFIICVTSLYSVLFVCYVFMDASGSAGVYSFYCIM
jgi:hypothetical protein